MTQLRDKMTGLPTRPDDGDDCMTPAEWADEAYNTMRMLVIVAVGAAGFWCAVGVILTGKWMGWW